MAWPRRCMSACEKVTVSVQERPICECFKASRINNSEEETKFISPTFGNRKNWVESLLGQRNIQIQEQLCNSDYLSITTKYHIPCLRPKNTTFLFFKIGIFSVSYKILPSEKNSKSVYFLSCDDQFLFLLKSWKLRSEDT